MAKKKTVYVGLSGGVDSSVAAALLLEQGYDVIPVFLKWWEPEAYSIQPTAYSPSDCPWREDQEAAYAVARHLGIAEKFRTWNFSEDFFAYVLQPLIEEAKRGRTGNPDVDCNRVVKFGAFLERALAEGADFVATGHYARVARHPRARNHEKSDAKSRETTSLLRAKCEAKNDQTYFLWQLTQEQLSRTLFPIGEFLSKEAVREEARKRGLPSADRRSTRGICGIEKRNYPSGYSDFLGQYIPEQEGDVVTTSGRVVGKHQGVARYTFGQRQGTGVTAGGGPYYVVEKDEKENRLVVAPPAEAQALWKNDVVIGDVHWISGSPPRFPLTCEAFIRHPQDQSVRCLVTRMHTNTFGNTRIRHTNIRDHSCGNSCLIRVVFSEAQWAPTPGQSVVFYDGDVVLGGGVIC